MKKSNQKSKKNREMFTLIELLVNGACLKSHSEKSSEV